MKLLTVLFTMWGTQILAQISFSAPTQRPFNEFSIYGRAGIPLLLQKDASSTGFEGAVGAGFTTFVSQRLGFHFGVGFGFKNVRTHVDYLETSTFGLIDANGFLFDKHTTLSGYIETKQNFFFEIPLMLQFQTGLQERRFGFYAKGGAKIQFLHQTSYSSRIETLTNLAYYPELGNWSATQTFANLGDFDGNSTSGNFNLDLFTRLVFEAGIKWRIRENRFVYTGMFINHNLRDFAQNHRMPLGEFTAPEHLTNFSLLNFSDQINFTTIGVQLRLAFARPPAPPFRSVPCPSQR